MTTTSFCLHLHPRIRQTEPVQAYSGIVLPRLFDIKEFNAFERATFARKIDDIFLLFRENPVANDYVLVGAIIEVDYEVVKKDGIACDPQLNCAKQAIAATDLDLAVIQTAIDLGVA